MMKKTMDNGDDEDDDDDGEGVCGLSGQATNVMSTWRGVGRCRDSCCCS